MCKRHGAKAKLCSSDGVPIMLRKEECAGGMGQRANYAVVKDAQMKLRKEHSLLKDVQIMQRREECALGMDEIAYEESITFD